MKKIRSGRSLAFSLNIYFLIVLTTLFLVVGVVLRQRADSLIREEQRENLELLADSVSDTLALEMESVGRLVFAHSLNPLYAESLRKGDSYKVDSALFKLKSQSEYFEMAYLLDREGLVMGTTVHRLRGEDYSDSATFRNAMKTVEPFLLEPTVVETSIKKYPGALITAPVVHNGQTLGVMVLSVNMQTFGNNLIVDRRIGSTGYSYVMDSRGYIFIHPDPEMVFVNASSLDYMDGILEGEEKKSFLSFSDRGTARQGVFRRMENPDWTVATVIDDREVFRLSREITIILIILLLAADLVLILFLNFVVNRKITRRLRPLERIMEEAAEGRIILPGAARGRDEVASISGSYKRLAASLGTFISTLGDKMNAMETEGEELAAHMEETAASVQQIRANIESSMKQIRLQDESVRDTAVSVAQAARSIELMEASVERQSRHVLDSSGAVEELIAQTRSVMGATDQAAGSMDELDAASVSGREKLDEVARLVSEISEGSHRLEDANKLISGIAARTNLLAMNAAIEAAHAGDAGRGFAVVADEIRKLAEQSALRSREVSESITLIKEGIAHVVEGSAESGLSFGTIQEGIGKMSRITAEIRSAMDELSGGGGEVLGALTEMKQTANDVREQSGELTRGNSVILGAVDSLRDISAQVFSAMEEINNGIGEINNSMSVVSTLSGNNRSNIEEVRRDASKYEV